MTTLDKVISDGRRVIGLSHDAHIKNQDKATISDLEKQLQLVTLERDKAVKFIYEQTAIIQKYNMVATGTASPDLVPSTVETPDTVENCEPQFIGSETGVGLAMKNFQKERLQRK